ncbi:MAG: hypothetical protein NZ518_05420 [Dehalococcoidia bacterium]|nr:hypothetical protein [Dehalococcoidia bacterium]
MSYRMVNLTPHEITIFDAAGRAVLARFLPHGTAPRLTEATVDAPAVEIGGCSIPVVKTTFGELVGFPDVPPAAIIIVNPLIAERVASRLGRTLYAPDTGPASVVRDAGGQIIGVRRLRRYDPAPQ